MAELTEKGIRRTVSVYGVGTLLATFTRTGIVFKAPGTKIGASLTWPQVLEACQLPDNIPSKFEGRPTEFIKHQIEEHTKSVAKRIAVKVAQEIQDKKG
jgi:hypothetical protein